MHRFFDWMMLVGYIAILFLLVRPGSKGPELVTKVGGSFVDLITAATGGGGWK